MILPIAANRNYRALFSHNIFEIFVWKFLSTKALKALESVTWFAFWKNVSTGVHCETKRNCQIYDYEIIPL